MGFLRTLKKMEDELIDCKFCFVSDYQEKDLQNLPEDIVSLEIQSFYKPTKQIFFPPLLRKLSMPFYYDFPLDNLPDSLADVYLPYNNQPIIFPLNLVKLEILLLNDSDLPIRALPKSLIVLRINGITKEVEWNRLSQLKILEIEGGATTIDKLPDSLKTLCVNGLTGCIKIQSFPKSIKMFFGQGSIEITGIIHQTIKRVLLDCSNYTKLLDKLSYLPKKKIKQYQEE